MSEKVKVSREVAVALNNALEECDGDENLVIETHDYRWMNECAPLNGFNAFEIARMFINGYEVEQAPEERFADLYNKALNEWKESRSNIDRAFLNGMKVTIEMMELNIEGVDLNA